jgi:hypothetical protein
MIYNTNILPSFGSSNWWRFYHPVILGLLNNPIPRIREYFRDQIVCCDHLDPKIKIAKIDGRSVHYQVDKDIRIANFYTLKANDNHIRKNFDRVLMPLHNWDLRISRVPILKTAFDLGFSTLTANSSTADGYIALSNANWGTVHDGATGSQVATDVTEYSNAISTYYSKSIYIMRSFFYFNTSSMGAGQAISSAILSLYGYTNGQSHVSIQKGTQAATLTTADYDSFTGTYFAYTTGTWSTSGYNAMTLDSGGQTWSNNNSVCYICAREYDHDYLNSTSGSSNYKNGCVYCEGNSFGVKYPKLVITYSAAATSKIKTINGINQANIKTGIGEDVAHLKSFNAIANQ